MPDINQIKNDTDLEQAEWSFASWTRASSWTDRSVLVVSSGIIVVFVIIAFLNLGWAGTALEAMSSGVTKYLGSLLSLIVFANVLVVVFLILSKLGSIRLGGDKPQMGLMTWVSLLFCTAIASGAVFFGTGEPLTHFTSPPPLYGDVQSDSEQAQIALQYSFLHWGFSAWAIYGIFAILLMIAVYHHGLPLRPSSAFYFVLGKKGVRSPIGAIIDIVSILGMVIGLVAGVGSLVLQMGFMLDAGYGITNTLWSRMGILVITVIAFVTSVAFGLRRGLARVSRWNVIGAVALGVFIFLIGPKLFIINTAIAGFGGYIQDFAQMSLFTGSTQNVEWFSAWTSFYWAWWLAWGPLMGVFLARISRGRTVRGILLGAIGTAAGALMLWFGVLGGSGIYFDIQRDGALGEVLQEGGMESVLFAILREFSSVTDVLVPAFLIVIVLFAVTSADSVSYAASIASTGHEYPGRGIRVFWSLLIGAVAALLITLGGLPYFQAATIAISPPMAVMLVGCLFLVPLQLRSLLHSTEAKLSMEAVTTDRSGELSSPR